MNAAAIFIERSLVSCEHTQARSSVSSAPEYHCSRLTHINFLRCRRVLSITVTQLRKIVPGSAPAASTMPSVNAAKPRSHTLGPKCDGSFKNSAIKHSARASHKEMILAAELFVKDVMKNWDSSHDWWHAERVRQVAVSLAVEEGLTEESQELVELAALLHDVGDHKYAKLGSAGPEAIAAFLTAHNYPEENTRTIMAIITRMGFKEELGGEMSNGIFPELAVVQDADRLDAIGAIGVARCLTYGGSRNRVLHDPESQFRETLSKEAYQNDSTKSTTIHHFYEKLLKLKDLMKTAAGRKRAAKRHEFMELFLETFYAEWRGEA